MSFGNDVIIKLHKQEMEDYKQKVREAIITTVMLDEELHDVPNFRGRRKDINYAIGEFKKKLLWVLKLDEARK